MASDKKPLPVFVFGEKNDPETIGIANGPNGLDIWLCYRGTIQEVTFYLNRETTFPRFHENNRRTFMPAKILSLGHEADMFNAEETLTGYTSNGYDRYYFKMKYDSNTQRGVVWFPNDKADPISRGIFVVVVEPSNGGHGPWSAPILTTYDGVKAVETARNAESLGFDINWKESQVAVFLMSPEKTYERQFFKRPDSFNPIVYKKCRGVSSDDTETKDEYFFDQELADSFGMTQALDEPSKPIQS